MRTTLDGVDIIHVRMYVLLEIGIVDHRYFHRCAVFLGVQMDNL